MLIIIRSFFFLHFYIKESKYFILKLFSLDFSLLVTMCGIYFKTFLTYIVFVYKWQPSPSKNAFFFLVAIILNKIFMFFNHLLYLCQLYSIICIFYFRHRSFPFPACIMVFVNSWIAWTVLNFLWDYKTEKLSFRAFGFYTEFS